MLTELTTALRELPGVESVGAAQQLPLRGGGYRAELRVDDRPGIDADATEYRIVSPGYFESVGIGLRLGRTIESADQKDAERVVVINEAFAQKYFRGLDPIGKLIGGDNEKRSRVVGVVANALETRLTEAAGPVRYVARRQMPWIDDAQSLVIRTAPGVAEASLLEAVRRTIARIAPAVAVQQATTMRRVLDTAIGPARQVVLLLSLLAGLALVLGAVGVYGVVTHFASRRRRDWAIRVAIGLPKHARDRPGSQSRNAAGDCRDCHWHRRRDRAHSSALDVSVWRERHRSRRIRRRRGGVPRRGHGGGLRAGVARGNGRPVDCSPRAVGTFIRAMLRPLSAGT